MNKHAVMITFPDGIRFHFEPSEHGIVVRQVARGHDDEPFKFERAMTMDVETATKFGVDMIRLAVRAEAAARVAPMFSGTHTPQSMPILWPEQQQSRTASEALEAAYEHAQQTTKKVEPDCQEAYTATVYDRPAPGRVCVYFKAGRTLAFDGWLHERVAQKALNYGGVCNKPVEFVRANGTKFCARRSEAEFNGPLDLYHSHWVVDTAYEMAEQARAD